MTNLVSRESQSREITVVWAVDNPFGVIVSRRSSIHGGDTFNF